MSETKRIKTALVSVYHKEGLDEIITKLHEEGVEFLSTGGTRQFIESLGYPCKAVEDLTTYPSILGGRVKTLHPKVFGGILCRRGLEQDMQQIEKYETYIEQLRKELEQKDKIIDLMAETINNYDIDEDVCKQMGQKTNCNEYEDAKECKECKECIKQYFINKAKEIR